MFQPGCVYGEVNLSYRFFYYFHSAPTRQKRVMGVPLFANFVYWSPALLLIPAQSVFPLSCVVVTSDGDYV